MCATTRNACVTHRFVEVMAHRVGQRADGVIEDQQVLVLVLAEGKHKRLEDEAEVGHEFGARLLLERRERRARRFLYALVRIQHSLQKLNMRKNGNSNC